jgi:hypothetical protein
MTTSESSWYIYEEFIKTVCLYFSMAFSLFISFGNCQIVAWTFQNTEKCLLLIVMQVCCYLKQGMFCSKCRGQQHIKG